MDLELTKRIIDVIGAINETLAKTFIELGLLGRVTGNED